MKAHRDQIITNARALRQIRRAHEKAVALAGSAAAFIEGPHDEALAAAAVAGEDAEGVGVHGEDALGARDVLRNELPLVIARPFDLHGVDGFDVAVFIAVVT